MNEYIQFAEELDDCATDVALYALGALSTEQANAVQLRLRSGCSFCAAQAENYAAVADQLSLSVTPVPPPAGLRDKLLARLKLQESGSAPTANRKVVRGGAESRWVPLELPGIEMRSLIGEKTFLLRMQPGAVFPKHNHPQAEQCYVLSGSITDSDGLTLHAGDFIVMSRSIQHDPIRSAEGCTLLIAYAD